MMTPKFSLSNQEDKVTVCQNRQTVRREGLDRIARIWGGGLFFFFFKGLLIYFREKVRKCEGGTEEGTERKGEREPSADSPLSAETDLMI